MKKRASRKRKKSPIHPTVKLFVSVHRDDVEGYINGVLDGSIVVGKLVRCAVERHLRDLKNNRTKTSEFFFDEVAANRVISFIECLKHSTGEFSGKNFLLLPWQKFLIWVLFGWKIRTSGMRRFREAFISLGRGNGKSPLAAALLLYLLSADQPVESRAEIKIAATERGKKEDNSGSMIVFNEAERLIQSSPALSKACKVLTKSIVFNPTGGTIVPMGKEAKTKDGFNLHAFVADELHEWQKEHQGVWSKLQTAMGKRRQPMAFMITTAGSDRSLLWKRKHTEAVKVVTGVYDDDALFVFSAEMDEGDKPLGRWAEKNVWPKANPNLGVSVKPEYLRRLAIKAKHDADEMNDLLRYHMNVMVRSRLKLFNMDAWEKCESEPLPGLSRKTCFGGIDLGWRDDLASFYLCFPLDSDSSGDRYAVKGWSWICDETPHHDLNSEPWASWIRSGRLIVTPGETFDPEAIVAKVKWAKKKYRIKTVAMDPNNARSVEVRIVNDLGIDVYTFYQSTKKYNEPIREFLDSIKDQRLITGGDQILKFAASNLAAKKDVMGLVMPDKEHSDEKIDPMCACLMAFSESLYHGRASKRGYSERGLRSLRGSSDA